MTVIEVAPESQEALTEQTAEAAPAQEATSDAPVAEPHQEPAESTDEPLFTVKVRGEEQQVTLDELLNGYQRQSDYTKSKQELAAERKQLEQAQAIWDALQEDPEGTIAELQNYFGPQETQVQDPEEQRIREVEAYIQQQQEKAFQDQLDKDLGGLEQEFGDFDRAELLQHAIDNEIPNLRAAFLHKRDIEEKNTRAAEALAAKRKTVAAPRTTTTSEVGPTEIPLAELTVARAFEAAKAELGL